MQLQLIDSNGSRLERMTVTEFAQRYVGCDDASVAMLEAVAKASLGTQPMLPWSAHSWFRPHWPNDRGMRGILVQP